MKKLRVKGMVRDKPNLNHSPETTEYLLQTHRLRFSGSPLAKTFRPAQGHALPPDPKPPKKRCSHAN